jgi:hypothetical protein
MAHFGAAGIGPKIGTVVEIKWRKVVRKKIGYAVSSQSLFAIIFTPPNQRQD